MLSADNVGSAVRFQILSGESTAPELAKELGGKRGDRLTCSSKQNTCPRVLEKQGRGPVSKKFEITEEGKAVLQQETLESLSSTRERDFKFDLALAAIPYVSKEAVLAALQQRKSFLTEVADGLNQKLATFKKKQMPVNMQALYCHPLVLIKNEIEFMDNSIQDLSEK